MTKTQPDSERIAQPTIGERATCEHCGREIVRGEYYWDHVGPNKPFHIATPLRVPVEPVQPDAAEMIAMLRRNSTARMDDLDQTILDLRSELAELKEGVAELKMWRQTLTGDGR